MLQFEKKITKRRRALITCVEIARFQSHVVFCAQIYNVCCTWHILKTLVCFLPCIQHKHHNRNQTSIVMEASIMIKDLVQKDDAARPINSYRMSYCYPLDTKCYYISTE